MRNLPVASLTQKSFLLVLICWTTGLTDAAFSLEEEFLHLKENYIKMNEIVKSMESQVIELKSEEFQLKEKVTELELKSIRMQEKVAELESKVQQQDSLLILLREINERTTATDFDVAPINNNQSSVAINGLPTSCEDLKMIGHIWSGFYSVMGSAMMESVYCDFSKLPSDPGFQKWIGYVDIKSEPVHFYVQRNSSMPNDSRTPISFSLAQVNEGNAMDLTTGIFTAPRPGIYFFSFLGHVGLPGRSSRSVLGIDFNLNGNRIGLGWVEEENTAGQLSLLTLQSTLNLKKGDQVWVSIEWYMGYDEFLYDDDRHFTHFTGFMLEEEIAASL